MKEAPFECTLLSDPKYLFRCAVCRSQGGYPSKHQAKRNNLLLKSFPSCTSKLFDLAATSISLPPGYQAYLPTSQDGHHDCRRTGNNYDQPLNRLKYSKAQTVRTGFRSTVC